MKKYPRKTERAIMLCIAFFQLLTFYALPLFAGPGDEMGMVFLMIVITFALSAVLGGVSKANGKYLYPIAVAVSFLPSVYIYYNGSAWIHSLWYLVVSFAGIHVGAFIVGIVAVFC